MVKVYTAEGRCQPCKATKRELTKLKVDFEEINVGQNPEAREYIQRLGFKKFPIVVTDTDSWCDFMPDKIALLGAEMATLGSGGE